ncbi:alpha- and gamma-adaptin-binding protein p34 [Ciona intestinalis]
MSDQILAILPTSGTSANKLIQDLQETENIKEHISGETYTWSLSNKYYMADVEVRVVKSQNLISEEFARKLEAVILLFDAKKTSDSLTAMKSWLPYIQTWECDIKLAVCERCCSVGEEDGEFIKREEVQLWCIDNGFELVELDPVLEDYDEYEDYGITRIRRAIGAHTWTHMKLKENEPKKRQDEPKTEKKDKEVVEPAANSLNMEEHIDAMLSNSNDDDQDDADFEALFQKMHMFKQSAMSMPENSRKEYAEKVVSAFWKAIGGEEEELSANEDG